MFVKLDLKRYVRCWGVRRTAGVNVEIMRLARLREILVSKRIDPQVGR